MTASVCSLCMNHAAVRAVKLYIDHDQPGCVYILVALLPRPPVVTVVNRASGDECIRVASAF